MALWEIGVNWRTGICGGDYLIYAVQSDSMENAEAQVKSDLGERYQGKGHYSIHFIEPLFDDGETLTVVSVTAD